MSQPKTVYPTGHQANGPWTKAVLLVAITTVSGACGGDLPAVANRVQQTVGTIEVYDGRGTRKGQGTGFFVDRNTVVTNFHVALGASSAVVRLGEAEPFEVVGVLAADFFADLVLLRTRTPAPRTLAFSSTVPRIGDPVLVVGSPLGLEGSVSDGIVAGFRAVYQVDSILQVTAPVSPGSSGSPVVNRHGRLVGVITSQIARGQNLNFATPVAKLRALAPVAEPIDLTDWSRGAFTALLSTADSLAGILIEPETPLYRPSRAAEPEETVAARQIYTMVADADSTQWRAWAGLGELLFRSFSGQDQRSRSHEYRELFLKATRHNPSYMHGYVRIAHSYDMALAWNVPTQANVDGLLQNALTAVRYNRTSPTAAVLLGSAHEATGNDRLAALAYRVAIAHDSTYREAFVNLGTLYWRTGNRARALEQTRILRALGHACAADMIEEKYDCIAHLTTRAKSSDSASGSR